MPTTEDLLTFLELHGTTAHDRCGELFIRSEFDRLIAVLMAHTYVSMLPEINRTGSVHDSVSSWANGLNLPGGPCVIAIPTGSSKKATMTTPTPTAFSTTWRVGRSKISGSA
jgi:hypothetical protein